MRFGFSFDALTFQCRCSCSLVGGRLLITFVPAQLMYSRVMRKRLRYRSVPTRCHGALCQHRAKGPRGRFGETLRKGLCFLVGPPMQIMNAGSWIGLIIYGTKRPSIGNLPKRPKTYPYKTRTSRFG